MVKVKKILANSALALSAAVVSAIGPMCQLSAYAEGEILVKMPGASGVQDPTWGVWDLTWTVGGQSVTLGTNTAETVVDDGGAQKALQFQSISDVRAGIYFTYNGNFCDTYEGRLSTSSNWSRELTCDYSPADEYGGNMY